jgi:hypothetical protein
MARAIAAALTIGSLLVLAGCGGSDAGATSGLEPRVSVAQTCSGYSGRTAAACEHSYYSCAREAPTDARKYHDGVGKRLDLVAAAATKGAYGEPERQGAFAGCLASMTDAYNRRYGGD